MSTPRHSFSVSELNGKFYLIGGKTGTNMISGPCLPLVEEYDPATEKWTKKADMPTPRAALSTCAVNDKIYAIGGMVEGMVTVPIVEKYDPSTDTWSRESDMLVNRCSMSMAVASELVDADNRYFPAVFADLARKAVIDVGDRIEITVMNSKGEIASGPLQYGIFKG